MQSSCGVPWVNLVVGVLGVLELGFRVLEEPGAGLWGAGGLCQATGSWGHAAGLAARAVLLVSKQGTRR